jgi:hypothetical protein
MPKRQVRLLIESMTCNKTTEAGADEVFVMVAARHTDGATSLSRWPGNGSHVDMNDGDQPTDNADGDSHTITNRALFIGELEEGQAYDLAVTLMEEDGGNTAKAQGALATALTNSGNPIAVAGGAVLGVATAMGLKIEDKDDILGAFSVRIVNADGAFSATFAALDRVEAEESHPDLRHGFRFIGDGSRYSATFGVTGS